MELSKADLIADLKDVAKKSQGKVTRDFYRENGKFSDHLIYKHFPTFADFVNAANINVEPETNVIEGDIWTISLPKSNIHTLEQLIDYCKIDLSVWEVEKFVANKWDANAGNGETMPLFQIKAFLKRRTAVINIQKELESLKNQAKSEARVPNELFERPRVAVGNMLEINIPDAHFGKMAWGVETGYGNYDVKIAQATFIRALNTLLDRVKEHTFDEIVFVVGNDLLNSNDVENRTAGGTVVTTDGRYHKTFYKVRSTIVECIEKLRVIAPVRVIMISGNHDTLSSWHLGDSLECYFHNYNDVIIENTPKYRKYYQFGQVMLMFTHGDKGKRQDYPLLMATEQPQMFGSTRFREAHTGHTHQTKLEEQHGVRVRVLPALCQADDWHAENGYVGNLRNAEAYIWNKNEGLIGMAIYSDDAQTPIITKRELV